MHTPCTVTCEVSRVVLFGEMYTPAPSASTLKVSDTTVRWAPMLTQARACTQGVVPTECMSPNTRCGPKSPFHDIAQKCACLLGLLFGGQGVGGGFWAVSVTLQSTHSHSFTHSVAAPGLPWQKQNTTESWTLQGKVMHDAHRNGRSLKKVRWGPTT